MGGQAMTGSISFEQLVALSVGRYGVIDAPCPLCGPDRRNPTNQRRKVLRIWRTEPNFITYNCERCKAHGEGFVREAAARRLPPVEIQQIRSEAAVLQAAHEKIQLMKVRSLWQRRREAVKGTPVHTYLRTRGYSGRIPATIGFLPASLKYPPAMITAIGMARETEPGELVIDDEAIRGVHITALKSDGSGKAGTERDKIMVGRSLGSAIVLAPPNDLLGLAITEGIEDALSVHQATGLGAWAAGSATRMPAIAAAIPDCVEAVTIFVDHDEAGRINANKLAASLANRIEVRLITPQPGSVAA
jgi:hypothetical protein